MIDDISELEYLREKVEIALAQNDELTKSLNRHKERDEQFRKLMGLLNTADGKAKFTVALPENSEETYSILVDRYIELMTKGIHMEIIEQAIKSDESVSNSWKQFMVMLRMAGHDGSQ